MTDLINTIAWVLGDDEGIFKTAVESKPLIDSADLPDELVQRTVRCAHLTPDEDSIHDLPCGWEGIADLAVFDDTREVLWWCPEGHENSEKWPA